MRQKLFGEELLGGLLLQLNFGKADIAKSEGISLGRFGFIRSSRQGNFLDALRFLLNRNKFLLRTEIHVHVYSLLFLGLFDLDILGEVADFVDEVFHFLAGEGLVVKHKFNEAVLNFYFRSGSTNAILQLLVRGFNFVVEKLLGEEDYL